MMLGGDNADKYLVRVFLCFAKCVQTEVTGVEKRWQSQHTGVSPKDIKFTSARHNHIQPRTEKRH